jgi:cytoskeletal protein RodZ
MTQHEPEYVWSFPPEQKRRPGRVWLIVGLSVAAVAVAVALFLLFLPRSAPVSQPTDTPSPTTSPTSTETPTATPTPTPAPTSTTSPTPSSPPATSPPPADPGLPVFRDKVRPVLTDADTGLRMLGSMSGQDAVQIVDQLRQDAERLSDMVAPSSISSAWRTRTDAYLSALSQLQSAYADGASTDAPMKSTLSAEKSLKQLVGL